MRRASAIAAASTVSALAAGALVAIVPVPAAQAQPAPAGAYRAVTPKRVLDTRSGPHAEALGARQQIRPSATAAGVPAGAQAVQITITTMSPTAPGGITAWGGSSPRPGTTNVHFSTGRGESDSAVVQVSDGRFALYNSAASGSVQVVVDVTGYWTGGTPDAATAGLLHTIAPTRTVDTRSGTGLASAKAIPARGEIEASLATPVPTGARAAAVTVTALDPKAAGTLIAYGGGTRPSAVTQRFGAGGDVSTFAIVPISTARKVTLRNSSASALNVVVDVAGYFVGGVPADAGAYSGVPPKRVSDVSAAAARATRSVRAGGVGGVPLATGTVAVVTVSVVAPKEGGGLTVWGTPTTRPGVSTVRFAGGESVAATTLVPLGPDRLLRYYNSAAGSARVIVDVVGYLPATTAVAPQARPSRYLNDLTLVTDTATRDDNATRMNVNGCQDADDGATYVLLDLGAQSKTPDSESRPRHLDTTHPGVTIALTGSSTTDPVRIQYGDLELILAEYLKGYSQCGGKGTVAIGTNNDGVFSGTNQYLATDRGKDWWTELVEPLRTGAPGGVTVEGAVDFEPGFAGTQAQAQQWESAYFGAGPTATLVNNGSADGCPTTIGTIGGTCNRGWTVAGIYALSHRTDHRVRVLPQIYVPDQAVQWANVDATGGRSLTFVGVLTESVDTDNQPAEGWRQLYGALSSVLTAPSLPQLIDIAPAS